MVDWVEDGASQEHEGVHRIRCPICNRRTKHDIISTRRIAHFLVFIRHEWGVAMVELVCRRCGLPFARSTSIQAAAEDHLASGRVLEAALLSCERALALGPGRDRTSYWAYGIFGVALVGLLVAAQKWSVPIPVSLGLVLFGLIAVRFVEVRAPNRYFERVQWPRVYERTRCTAVELREARGRLGGLVIAKLLSDREIERLTRSAGSNHGSIDRAHRSATRKGKRS